MVRLVVVVRRVVCGAAVVSGSTGIGISGVGKSLGIAGSSGSTAGAAGSAGLGASASAFAHGRGHLSGRLEWISAWKSSSVDEGDKP